MTPETLDLIAGWVSLVLTLFIFSYLLGDNVLYRLAIHVLVGVAAAYALIVATESVIKPWLEETLLIDATGRDEATVIALRVIGPVPFLVGALLLFKVSPRLAAVGNLGLVLLIGVGVAVAIAGAVSGTILPLAREAGRAVDDTLADGLVILVGTITALLYFQFFAVERRGVVQRPPGLRSLSLVGQFFVMVTLGALYAGAILTSLAVFSDVVRTQLEFIIERLGN
ncbi:MAG: hypothetical protein ACUVSU_11745 [Aggregatilineaceae bacterium]